MDQILDIFNGLNEQTAIPSNIENAILTTHWAGRNQLLKIGNITYCLDGAHTPKSIECCMNWFQSVFDKNSSDDSINILLFHCTADRDPATLLSIIASKYQFQLALFCPTRLLPSMDLRNDNTNLNQSIDEQWQKCLKSQSVWNSLNHTENGKTFTCIKESLDHVHEIASNNKNVNLLVTGSLHLVGGVLSFEDSRASL